MLVNESLPFVSVLRLSCHVSDSVISVLQLNLLCQCMRNPFVIHVKSTAMRYLLTRDTYLLKYSAPICVGTGSQHNLFV